MRPHCYPHASGRTAGQLVACGRHAVKLLLSVAPPPAAAGAKIHRERIDAAAVHFADAEHGSARRDPIADDRQAAERAEDEAADRRVVLVRARRGRTAR